MANKLKRADLLALERYHEERSAFRRKVLLHKRNRKVFLGPHAALYFEDALTVQYQIQEMLRVERIFAAAAIEEELEAYNPLIPDGDNWKATLMLEYEDEAQRRAALETLIGIENHVWMRIADDKPIYAIANEDLERSNDTKTSAVHFLRFQLQSSQLEAAQAGCPLAAGISHPAYIHQADPLPPDTANALRADLR